MIIGVSPLGYCQPSGHLLKRIKKKNIDREAELMLCGAISKCRECSFTGFYCIHRVSRLSLSVVYVLSNVNIISYLKVRGVICIFIRLMRMGFFVIKPM
jgi:hypothetical protein